MEIRRYSVKEIGFGLFGRGIIWTCFHTLRKNASRNIDAEDFSYERTTNSNATEELDIYII